MLRSARRSLISFSKVRGLWWPASVDAPPSLHRGGSTDRVGALAPAARQDAWPFPMFEPAPDRRPTDVRSAAPMRKPRADAHHKPRSDRAYRLRPAHERLPPRWHPGQEVVAAAWHGDAVRSLPVQRHSVGLG